MVKKNLSIIFVFLAYSLLLLHSVIPHHHHDEESTEQHSTSDSDDDDHGDIDHNFLAHAFSILHHDVNGIVVYETATPVLKYSKAHIDKDVFLLANYIAGILHKPPLIHSEPDLPVLTSLSCIDAIPLRGPPTALA